MILYLIGKSSCEQQRHFMQFLMASIHILKVNKKNGLSPGAITKKLARLRDAKAKRNKAISLTRKAKKRRLQLKAKR